MDRKRGSSKRRWVGGLGRIRISGWLVSVTGIFYGSWFGSVSFFWRREKAGCSERFEISLMSSRDLGDAGKLVVVCVKWAEV